MNFFNNWKEEKRSATLYRILAEVEKGTPRGNLFKELAADAEEQAVLWVQKIVKLGKAAPASFEPDLRTRLVAVLIHWMGPRHLKTVLAAMKVRGMSVYTTGAPPGHPFPSSVQEVGQRHRGARSGGNLRAAVFGISDGLVSNASLIFGMAGGVLGASGNPKIIVLSGIAGLLAGAFSMSAGEFLSVRSQKEMFEYQIGLEREELNEYPREEAEELALIYQAKGLPEEEARSVAIKLINDPERALDTLAREELGLNPEDLGSPWGAAMSSFSAFACGAAVPLIPFLIGSGERMMILSIALTGTTLFAVGAVLSLFTGRSAVLGGLRMLLIGGAAGGVTYFIGHLLGVAMS